MSGIEQQLAALRADYLASLPAIAARMRADFRAACDGDQQAMSALRHEVHKLAGNAAAFEFMPIARLASELDAYYTLTLEHGSDASLAATAQDLQSLASMLDNTAQDPDSNQD